MKSMYCAYKNGNLISVSQSPTRNNFFAPPYLTPPYLLPLYYAPLPWRYKIWETLQRGKQKNRFLTFLWTWDLANVICPRYYLDITVRQIWYINSMKLLLLSVYKFIFASALICLPLSFLIQYVEKIWTQIFFCIIKIQIRQPNSSYVK